MSRKLALEIAGVEARVLLLDASESSITVEKSLLVPFVSNGENGEGDDAKNTAASVEQTVVDALSAAGISRVETIAVVGRADVELRLLHLPKAPEAELPDIVRFQVMQELPGVDNNTPMDYLPLHEADAATGAIAGGESQRVLAAVLKPGVMDRLKKICRDAKLTLARIVLRPAAAASLMLREKPELSDGCCLLLELLGRQVELAAVNRGQVVFLRHILLPGEPMQSSQAAQSLFAEIRRTRIIVSNQENVEQVGPIVLVGNSPAHAAFAEQLAAQTESAVCLADPLPESVVSDPQKAVDPEVGSRHAALLGAVADEARRKPQAFDFLHPRRPPEPVNRRNTYVLAGLLTATVVLALIAFNWVQTASLKNDIRRIKQETAALEPEVKKADKLVADAGKVKDWLAGEVVWLDQLAWLSRQFPEAKDAMLTNFHAVGTGSRREIRLGGFARDIETATKLDAGLCDATHQLEGKTKKEDRTQKGYTIQFRSSVRIDKQ